MKIKKGDEVIIITGKDKGKKGKVEEVLLSSNKIVVTGVNIVVKNMKPTKTHNGGMIKKSMPIHISNVAYVDPKLVVATKLGYKYLEDGKKVRVSKRSQEILQ